LRIIDWYVGRTIFFTTFMVLLTLQGLSSIIKFVEQLDRVGEGSYQILDALLFVLLTIPKELEIFFPMAALLGSLIGLGTLASSSELIVMQAAGLSRFNIATAVIKTALPMMLAMMLLSEFVAPKTEMFAKNMRTSKIYGGSMIAAQSGVWAKDGERFVKIGEVRDGDQLADVIIYYFDESLELYQVLRAEDAIYDDGHWVMRNVDITQFKDELVELRHVPEYLWVSSLSPDKLGIVSIKPFNLSLSGLYSYIDYLKQNKQDASRYELAMWRKVVMPLTVAVMMLLALSFVFGPLRSVSMGARLLMGIVWGFAFYVSNEMLASVSLVYNLPPAVGAFGPSFIFLAFAGFLINRRS
jgi:lipopolysaccharide export system permease protein